MDLNKFREANVKRCNEAFHPLDSWSPTDWATAMAGEMGEACNLIKKLRRGDFVDEERCSKLAGTQLSGQCNGKHRQHAIASIADELADLITYADLLAASLGINLSESLRRKFNAVSVRVGSEVIL